MIEDIFSESLEFEKRLNCNAYFSDCGSFVYFEQRQFEPCAENRLLLSEIQFPPQPLRVFSNQRRCHPSMTRAYILRTELASVSVDMYEYDSPPNGKLPFYQKAVRKATAECITAYPFQFGHDVDAWLLLGEDYSTPMRLLLRPREDTPPVLKTLLLSWNDVLKILAEKSFALREIE
jgi:hypothetical protein